MACSRVTPNDMIAWTVSSGYLAWPAPGWAAGWTAGAAAMPPGGTAGAPVCSGCSASSIILGSSCSGRKPMLSSPITSALCFRSMHAWWRLSMSRPNSRSTCFPSITVNEHSSICPPTFICALCTRPRILACPTPRAMPANRVSSSRMIPQRSAQSGLIIVAWAPESTNALTGVPLTSTLMYSIVTCANDSGLCSIAISILRATFSCRIASSMRRCASTLNGSAFSSSISCCRCCSACCRCASSCPTSRANSAGFDRAARSDFRLSLRQLLQEHRVVQKPLPQGLHLRAGSRRWPCDWCWCWRLLLGAVKQVHHVVVLQSKVLERCLCVRQRLPVMQNRLVLHWDVCLRNTLVSDVYLAAPAPAACLPAACILASISSSALRFSSSMESSTSMLNVVDGCTVIVRRICKKCGGIKIKQKAWERRKCGSGEGLPVPQKLVCRPPDPHFIIWPPGHCLHRRLSCLRFLCPVSRWTTPPKDAQFRLQPSGRTSY
ncbi:hypothetical protein DL89DRAFT_22945 [Linderina pennispora]|uniref:Uncharacterized protein n=1 Tax=Linderina pennispora TaxID=61395 RepID=A0A1Y1WML1_9FUNG|nr:uncharacterized protein DL89DRAFT_22945 [Linderina pennispora]ORX74797.1 hypothetical protein DL89DRAFT_22945 [Linderina pennispora]